MKTAAPLNKLPEWIRWGTLLWLAIWIPAYWRAWGPVNFLHVCDVAVLLTCVGLWTGNRLLLSSQAVSSLLVNSIWTLDVAFLLVWKRPFFGGTQFLLDVRIPLWVRLLSLYHVLVPVVLLWALSKIGYDRRAWALQCGITLAAMLIARFTNPFENINFAFRDPFWGRQLGPLPLHMGISIVFAGIVVYAPTHFLLLRLYRGVANPASQSSVLRERNSRQGERMTLPRSGDVAAETDTQGLSGAVIARAPDF
jgi:hypothetical protein